jgi:uncharacterized protein (TIRG00374 family)
MNRSRILSLSISLVVGAACLFLAFRGVDMSEAKDAIAQVPWWAHAAYLGALIAQYVIRSPRWAIQVEGLFGKRPPFREAMAVNAVAFASVFLIPFRLGEFVRPYLTAQRGYMKLSSGIANSAVERILDGLVTTAFFGVVLFFLGDTELPKEVRWGGVGALALFGGGSFVLLVAYRFRSASERFWMRLIGIIHEGLARKLVGMLSAFLDGLKCFKDGKAFAEYLGLSVVFWLWNGGAMWMMLRFMGVEVSPLVGYFAVCFLVIGVMMPAPPGNVGNFHYFASLGLTLLGVPKGTALAFAIIIHAWQVISLIAWAGFWVLKGDVSLDKVREATRAGEEDEMAEVTG